MTSDGTIWTGAGPYRLTWDDYGALVGSLIEQVRRDGFRPDAICAIARGGLVPAGYLAAALEVERMSVVRVRRTLDDRVYADKQPPSLRARPDDLSGCARILVVDDVAGTGATAALVDAHVRDQPAGQPDRDVRLAVLAHNPRSAFRPTYYGVRIDDWIVFPWEPAPDGAAGRPLPLDAP